MEIQLLQSLEHPNIVQYIDTIAEPDFLNIVLEYIEAGQLSSLLSKLGGTPPETLIAFYTAQILIGLQYLHREGVVHRDIKGANILSTKEGLVKLADFGVATKLTDVNSGPSGTPYWMAPEVIEMKEEQMTANDIWSMGCTVLEFITGKPPYFDLNPMAACYRIVQDPQPPIPDGLSVNLEDFLVQCFVKNPERRPDATALLQHPFVSASVALIEERLQKKPQEASTNTPMRKKTVTGDAPVPKEVKTAPEDFTPSSILATVQLASKAPDPRPADIVAAFNRNLFALETSSDEDTTLRVCMRIQRDLEQPPTQEIVRELLLEGVMPTLQLVQNSPSLPVQEALFRTLYVALTQPSIPVSPPLLTKLRNALGMLGLVSLAAKAAGSPLHSLQVVSAAILRLFCWDDPSAFVAGGGLFGIQRLLTPELKDVGDKKALDPRLQWTAVDCLHRLTENADSTDASVRDRCLKLACSFDFVRSLVQNFNTRAADLNVVRGRKPLKARVSSSVPDSPLGPPLLPSPSLSDSKRAKAMEARGGSTLKAKPLEKAINEAMQRLCGTLVDGAHNWKMLDPLDQAFASFGGVQLTRSFETSDNVSDNENLVFAIDCQTKIARVLNTISKSHDLARQKFGAADMMSSLVTASVSFQEPEIAAIVINTVAVLESTPRRSKFVGATQNEHQQQQLMSDLVFLLKTFLALGDENLWQWAAADTLHCLNGLSKDNENEHSEAGLLSALKHYALMPQLHYMLIAINLVEDKSERSTQRKTTDEVILRREGEVRIMQFLFPLLFRIATSDNQAIRSYIHQYKPDIFLGPLVHPEYSCLTLDLLYVWLKDDRSKLETFLGRTETVQRIVNVLRSCGASEYAKALTTLTKILSYGQTLTMKFFAVLEFCAEIREGLCVRFAKENNVRLLLLRILHLFISRADSVEQLEQLNYFIDLHEVLTLITQDSSSRLVATLADYLLGAIRAIKEPDHRNATGGRGKYTKKGIKKCMLCGRVFGLFLRKHSCKQCQQIICPTCSPDRAIVPHVDKAKMKRICNMCSGFISPKKQPEQKA